MKNNEIDGLVSKLAEATFEMGEQGRGLVMAQLETRFKEIILATMAASATIERSADQLMREIESAYTQEYPRLIGDFPLVKKISLSGASFPPLDMKTMQEAVRALKDSVIQPVVGPSGKDYTPVQTENRVPTTRRIKQEYDVRESFAYPYDGAR